MFRERFFKKVCFLSIVSVFLLFILGGLVRSTGSGMGCPDWPKCFGQLAPPSDTLSLPADYRQQFLEKRLHKVERTINLLKSLGLKELAEKVANDPALKIAHPYDRKTAYIEYINRLFGVLTGIFSLLTFISALGLRKTHPGILRWSSMGLFWVIFNGWLGSIVVQTNLLPGVVTVHYAASYLSMGGFILALSPTLSVKLSSKHRRFILGSLIVSFIVMFMGTSTRESIDLLKQNDHFVLSNATVWVPGTIFLLHRLFGIVLFLANAYLWWQLRKDSTLIEITRVQTWVLILFTLQIISGFINVFYDIPAMINVVHIAASAAIVGLQFRVLVSKTV